MTSTAAIEILLSLTLQTTLLIVACRWLIHCERDDRAGERGWAGCHVLILVLTGLAWTAPHLRLFSVGRLIHPQQLGSLVVYESAVAECLLAVWMGGLMIQLMQLALGVFQSARLVRDARNVDGETTQTLLGDERARLGPRLQNLEFRVSSRTKTPFCWHISQPMIILPEGFLAARAPEMQAIVRHELAHLRSGHPLQLLLQRLVEVVYWYLPVVWWASYQARRHREFVCDDEAVRSMREASSYLKGLLLISQSGSEPMELSAGWAFCGEGSLIQERAARIARRAPHRNGRNTRWNLQSKLIAVAVLMSLLWLPANATASGRSMWSPWPSWTAEVLHEFGIVARDYEIDGHRLQQHPH